MEMLIDNVQNIGLEEFYRVDRYNTDLYLLLINSKDANAFNILDYCTRQTDIVQQIASDMVVVFLSHTNHENTLKFIEKITNGFDFTYTYSQYKEHTFTFLQSLFVENSTKRVD